MPSSSNAGKARSEAYFLDANIPMYAIGAEHALRAVCRAALERAVSQRAVLITDSEVLQEVLYRYFALRKPEIAVTVYRATVSLCVEVLPVGETHTARALELLLDNPGLSARDAIHVATMEGSGLRRILSTDTDFDGLSRIQRIDPADFLV